MINKLPQLGNAFIAHACAIFADTQSGLSGSKIVEICNAYALEFGREIPHTISPFTAPNKRTALIENLSAFNDAEQFRIINEIADLSHFKGNEDVRNLKLNLFQRYGHLSKTRITETELIQKTKHWLEDYPESLKQYENALKKFEGGFFQRNALDDMRLAFELLLKDILGNNKSIENQIANIGDLLKKKGSPNELRNMFQKLVEYYTRYQNDHVKHDESINELDVELVIELTSIFMKHLIKITK